MTPQAIIAIHELNQRRCSTVNGYGTSNEIEGIK